MDEVIDLTEDISGDERELEEDDVEADANDEGLEDLSRRDILTPFIQSTVAALGGFVDAGKGRSYEMGDACLGCLRDLKKFWRKDDTDDERTVARIFWETRVLPNDLVPILLETAGKGAVTDKRAIACADLITAMTWPIDVAEELQELDDERDAGTDYTTLIQAQLAYKAALLQPGVLKALLDIMTPSLLKTKRDRTEKDGQVINVILHAFRNLAFIKDLTVNAFKSSDRVEYSSLQSKMIVIMKEDNILDVFTSLAANSGDSTYNPYNALLLEIYYLLLRGVKPQQLTLDPKKQSTEKLKSLLEVENKSKMIERRQGASRHSRFGTTVAIKSGHDQYIVHKQTGITADAASVMSRTKIKPARKIKRQDELASFEELSVQAIAALQTLAIEFMDSCFEEFFSSLLKDIKAERAKITESDNIRLLAVVKWFLEFFLASRAKELAELKGAEYEYESLRWRFEMVGEVIERSWIGWVLRRMRMAMDDKPKQWTELRAGMDCLSQLLLLLEQMSLPESPDFAHQASKGLQHQLYYSGEILEISFDSLKGYKEQSIAYLDSTIHLAYLLLRMLERWAKTQGQMYVRKSKKAKKKSRKGKVGEEDGIVDVESEDEEDQPGSSMWNEHMFTFEKYESKFAQEDITRACLAYLQRYREFSSPDQMKRVVSLMHRQAVKVKAEGLFFKVTTLELFNRILDDQKTFPRDTAYKELVTMVNFLLRKFFKAVEESPFLVVEAFYPKNRGQWKQFSSFEPDARETAEATSGGRKGKGKDATADVEVKKGHTDQEKLGIAIAVLLEQEKAHLVDWVRSTLMTVIGLRLAIISEVNSQMEAAGISSDQPDGEDATLPSAEAMRKFEDYSIPYVKEEQAQAATKDPYLKLVLRLIDCHVLDLDAEELEWFFPAALTPDDLQKHLDVISRYLEEPIDLGGKAASTMIQKKRATRRALRRTRRSASASDSDADAGLDSDEELLPKKWRTKRQKEEIQYKSAEFIEDSDIDLDADAAFFAKEEEIRQRANLAAESGKSAYTGMRTTGTKKRKRGKNPQAEDPAPAVPQADDRASASPPPSSSRKRPKPSERGSSDVDDLEAPDFGDFRPSSTQDEESVTAVPRRARPRPRPRFNKAATATGGSSPASSSPPPNTDFPASSTAGSDAEAPKSIAEDEDGGRDGTPDVPHSDDQDEIELTFARRGGRRKAVVFSDDDE